VSAFRVALTFDAEHPDRPATPGIAEALIEQLVDLDVASTFFIQGRWAEAYPETARSIAAAAFHVGSHSHYHARMPLLSDAGLAEDVRVAEATIREIVGVDPRPWFRCPFGAGSNDERVLRALTAGGYRNVGWHVAADDWEPRPVAAIEEDIVAGTIAHGDGAVVLLHAWPDRTLAAIPGVVSRLRDRGATFVRADELEDLPALPFWMQAGGTTQEAATSA
jgi:peptidoglycan/xylan/chitin deacetylase (PgdA/CDA1 family)